MAYHRVHAVRVSIARIFNTYGPRMRRDDGRAVPTFVSQALRGEPITVHGDGSQTRSLCYVDDLVEGLWRLFVSDLTDPVNLGNPEEVTVLELAERVRVAVGAEVPIEFTERPEDDPQVRRPTSRSPGSSSDGSRRCRSRPVWSGWSPGPPRRGRPRTRGAGAAASTPHRAACRPRAPRPVRRVVRARRPAPGVDGRAVRPTPSSCRRATCWATV